MGKNKAILFPSEDWFRGLVSLMGEQEATYRELGATDCTMVVKVTGGASQGTGEDEGEKFFEVVFEDYGADKVRELASIEEASASHFVLEASLETWREMIDNIRDNGSPDLEHTLNYLTFPDDPMLVTGPDQL